MVSGQKKLQLFLKMSPHSQSVIRENGNILRSNCKHLLKKKMKTWLRQKWAANIKHCVNKSTGKTPGLWMDSIWNVKKKEMIIKKNRMHLKIFYSKSLWPSTQISRNVATLVFLQQLWPLLLLLPCSKRSICTGTGNWTQTDLTFFFFFFFQLDQLRKSQWWCRWWWQLIQKCC